MTAFPDHSPTTPQKPNDVDSAHADIYPPVLGFDPARRILIAILVAAIALPISALAAYGYLDYQRRRADAEETIERLARVVEEHGEKVLDINRQMIGEISEMLDDSDDDQILAHRSQLYPRLKAIRADFPQVAAVAVFGKKGDLLLSSELLSPPAINVSEREAFRQARDMRPLPFISLPSRRPVFGLEAFGTNFGRSGADGHFLGVISVGLKREYFHDFYHELLGSQNLLIGLYRSDGGILVRLPADASSQSTASNAAMIGAIASSPRSGLAKSVSPIDGVERLIAFRRIERYSLYASVGIATAELFDQWRKDFGLVSSAVMGPVIGMWVLIIFSLRRLKSEQTAWQNWRSETSMRVSAEDAARQLQRMGALGNLVASVAHDFNNLLMVVDANMELARRKNYTDVHREVHAVQRASIGAQRLARRLMSVARKQPLKLERIDVAAWFQAAKTMIATALGEKSTLKLDVPSDVSDVCIDQTELESAVINLTVNAKDAMPEGGQLIIRCKSVVLTHGESAVPAGRYVSISFTDEGRGMSAEVRRRAFEPLFTTKSLGQGTGLGLAQVLAACEQAGGTAKLISALGEGTTVELLIPKATDSQPAENAGASDTQPRSMIPEDETGSGARVLLVEDNEEVAAGIMAVLEVFGCEVRHEINASDALEALSTGQRFDLVLSDIQMPGPLNGLDLAEKIRRERPQLNIALMTGYADQLERARILGITILAKPFDMDSLKLLVTLSEDGPTRTKGAVDADATRP